MTAYADAALPSRPSVLSFKGRSTRKEYWTMVAVLVGLQVALALLLPRFGSGGIIFTLMWARTYSRRLHDVGESGWMQCLLYGGQAVALTAAIIWAWPDLVAGGRAPVSGAEAVRLFLPVLLGVVVAFLMQAAYTVWLGLRPGQADDNRFGPPPRPQDVAATFA